MKYFVALLLMVAFFELRIAFRTDQFARRLDRLEKQSPGETAKSVTVKFITPANEPKHWFVTNVTSNGFELWSAP